MESKGHEKVKLGMKMQAPISFRLSLLQTEIKCIINEC